jgi:hypothetical protein
MAYVLCGLAVRAMLRCSWTPTGFDNMYLLFYINAWHPWPEVAHVMVGVDNSILDAVEHLNSQINIFTIGMLLYQANW